MINPDDIKVGAQFRTRCGGIATIDKIFDDPNRIYILRGRLKNSPDNCDEFWTGDGHWTNSDTETEFDLIELIQPNTMNKTYYCKVTNPKLHRWIVNQFRDAGRTMDDGSHNQATILLSKASGILDTCDTPGKDWNEVTIEEFLALLEKPKTISVKLQDYVEAEVESGYVDISVNSPGTYRIPFSKIEEIVAAHAKLS